jgi:hypothetical protein
MRAGLSTESPARIRISSRHFGRGELCQAVYFLAREAGLLGEVLSRIPHPAEVSPFSAMVQVFDFLAREAGLSVDVPSRVPCPVMVRAGLLAEIASR